MQLRQVAVLVALIAASLICIGSWASHPASAADVEAMQSRLTRGAMGKFRFAEKRNHAPDISLKTPSGDTVALSSLRGKVILLNVWASWCPPCREEMPSLARLAKFLERDLITVVALSIDKQPADAVRFLQTHGANSLPLYVDPGATIAEALGAVGLPVSILIDAEGREIGRLRGSANWMSDEAILLLRAVLRDEAQR